MAGALMLVVTELYGEIKSHTTKVCDTELYVLLKWAILHRENFNFVDE